MAEQKEPRPPERELLPAHIGIILDGNGRWAKQRGLPRTEGHRRGADTFSKIVRYANKIGIKYLTAYAFSTENWSRPKEEVDMLMKLLSSYLNDVEKFTKENARLVVLGDKSRLPVEFQEKIRRAEEGSRQNTGLTLNIALNYGGRDDILRAVKKLASEAASGTLNPEQLTEQMISDSLDTAGQPDPDLIIRPSGEQRLSNFLIWQAAYSEFVFLDVLWPDFTPEHLNYALKVYAGRNRRFGGLQK